MTLKSVRFRLSTKSNTVVASASRRLRLELTMPLRSRRPLGDLVLLLWLVPLRAAPVNHTAQLGARAALAETVDWTRCYAGFSPTGNPKSDLRRITRSCGGLGGMRPITGVTIGEQSERAPADRYTFFVPQEGACFRIFATADRNVRDLDLLLRTPDGEAVAGDLTHDSWPVVPPEGPACFEAARDLRTRGERVQRGRPLRAPSLRN